MASGCAVIASNRGGLPEACGGAAELVDPDDLEQVVSILRSFTRSSQKLIEAKQMSQERASRASWSHTADLLEAVFNEHGLRENRRERFLPCSTDRCLLDSLRVEREFQTMTVGNLLERSLAPLSRSLNAAAARELLALRAPAALQNRMDKLAALCNEGLSSGEELAEYDTLINAANLIGILQAEARSRLQNGTEKA